MDTTTDEEKAVGRCRLQPTMHLGCMFTTTGTKADAGT
jgi:hypothetical protein